MALLCDQRATITQQFFFNPLIIIATTTILLTDHWTELERGIPDLSEDGVDRPQHQHLAAAATTLGIIFGVIGFIVAIITACAEQQPLVHHVQRGNERGVPAGGHPATLRGGEWKKGSRSHLTPPGLGWLTQ